LPRIANASQPAFSADSLTAPSRVNTLVEPFTFTVAVLPPRDRRVIDDPDTAVIFPAATLCGTVNRWWLKCRRIAAGSAARIETATPASFFWTNASQPVLSADTVACSRPA